MKTLVVIGMVLLFILGCSSDKITDNAQPQLAKTSLVGEYHGTLTAHGLPSTEFENQAVIDVDFSFLDSTFWWNGTIVEKPPILLYSYGDGSWIAQGDFLYFVDYTVQLDFGHYIELNGWFSMRESNDTLRISQEVDPGNEIHLELLKSAGRNP